jgi:hypothetical protein
MCLDLRIQNIWRVVPQITIQRTSTNWPPSAHQSLAVVQVPMMKLAHCWITIVVTRIL